MKTLVVVYYWTIVATTLAIGVEHFALAPQIRASLVAHIAGAEYAVTQLGAFAKKPLLIGVHAAAGIAFGIAAPLQLAPWIRRRFRRLHRICGWIFIAAAWATGLTGIGVGYAYPFAGRASLVPNVVFASMLVAFTTRAVISARRRDFAEHERWMVRSAAIGLGIGIARLCLFVFVQGFGLPASAALGQVFWLGCGSNLVLAETWLRRRRAPRAPALGLVPSVVTGR
jgi:uncharacterized membrane protein